MNMKKNFKRFFTLDRHASAGFTLVELIVVIAILAILAGVAIPAYSGYVKKAERAGDEQLLAAVNTAFAAACTASGEDYYGRSDTSAVITDGAAVISVKNIPDFINSYTTFFAGNENSRFKVFTHLQYSSDVGGFIAAEIPQVYAGLLAAITGNQNFTANKDAMLLSTFMTANGLGVEGVLNQVGQLSGVADTLLSAVQDVDSSGFASMVWSPDFMNDLAVKAGYADWSEYSETFSEDELNTVLANGAILSVANNTASLNTDYLTAGGLKNRIQTNMDDPSTSQQAFAEASLAYGMYMSYAYSTGNQAMIDNASNISDTTGLYAILDEMESEAFRTYLTGDQGQKDLEGYKAAMSMINSTSDDKKAVENVLLNGFDDPALITLLQQAMG